MCGIAGQLDDGRPIERSRLESMTAALAHRGPDDDGTWYEDHDEVGLGHRRLSILDLSHRGHQPMTSACGRYVIAFNGEIYNYETLRATLEGEGERFVSSGDTEVLLRLWARGGLDCLSMLRGMYAFGLWDRSDRRLWLVRDPLGIKPLYYSHAGRSLTFASEVRALQCGVGPVEIDPEGVGAFLRLGSVPAPLTVFKGIRALPPGCAISMSLGTACVRLHRHWTLPMAWETSRRLTEDIDDQGSANEWTRAAVEESVRAHLVSDVPVGAFLSGGIDSAAIVALARRAGTQRLHTFSIGSDDSSLDELAEARETADHYETVHHEMTVRSDDFRAMLPSFIGSLDQPTIDGFNTYLVSRFAHEHAVKVVVSGVGGDELFRGYHAQFRRLPAVARSLSWLPGEVRHRAAAGVRAVSALTQKHRARRAGELLTAEPTIASVYLWSRELFTPDDIRWLCADADFAEQAAAVNVGSYVTSGLPQGASAQAALTALETTRYLGPQLLRDSDQFSMASSIELRTPLVDKTLYEQLLALPDRYFSDRGRSSKPLLVAAAGLPPAIKRRPKRGFSLPFGQWLRQYPVLVGTNVFDAGAVAKVQGQVRSGYRKWTALWALEILSHYLNVDPHSEGSKCSS